MATVRTLDVAIRANTQNFQSGMQQLSRGLKGAITGMNAVAAAAAGTEKSMLGMANAIAIGFASGGPMGAGIAALGVGVGLLIGKTKELGEASTAAAKKWAESMDKMRSETKKVADRVDEMRLRERFPGFGDTELELLKTGTKIMNLEQRLRGAVGQERHQVETELTELRALRAALVELAEREATAQERIAAAAADAAAAEERMKGIAFAPLPGGGGRMTRMEWAEAEARRNASMFTRAEPGAGTGTLTGAWDMKEFSGKATSTIHVIDEVGIALDEINRKASEAASTTTNFLMGMVSAGRDAQAQLQNVLGLLLQLASQQIYKGLFTAFGGQATGVATP